MEQLAIILIDAGLFGIMILVGFLAICAIQGFCYILFGFNFIAWLEYNLFWRWID